jgi:hypothetical protein
MMLRTFLIAVLAGVGALLLLSSPAKADGPTRDDCMGDVDGDGDTDLSDLAIWVADWGCEPPPVCPGDLDGDGDTDSSDLGILLADWGCPDDDPGCDGEPSDALEFQVITVDNSGVMPPNYYTFDLVVEVEDGDDWTAILAEAELTDCPDCMFYQAPNGQDYPQPDFFGVFPELEFDCWYTVPACFPNGDGVFSPGFAEIENQDRYLRAVWFDVDESGGGAFILARYTIVVPEESGMVLRVVPYATGGPIVGMLDGVATSREGWGDCNTFAFDIVLDCLGDLDGDSAVAQSDLGILLADWGCASDCVGDLDGDDDVDQADLGILLVNWGSLCGEDCNENGISDWRDVHDGTSDDCNHNRIPDECEVGWDQDCNENGVPDLCDIYDGTSQDFNNNGIPDECEENRTVYVDDDAPNDPGPGDPNISDPDEDGTPEHPFDAIQEAMHASLSGDTILVADGVYTGTGNKEIDFGGREVLLCSVNGPQTCTIDMEGSGRGFLFQSGETRAAQVTGFTISNGDADVGAGICCTDGSSPTITDCIISANTADSDGGGVRCYDRDSYPAFIDCLIVGNTAGSRGGGIRCSRSDATFTNCIIAGNTAGTSGGGISCHLSDSTFTNCVVAANTAGSSGGGVWCYHCDSPFTNCLMTGNTANEGGGVYCSYGGSPVFANCVLWGDTPQEIYVLSVSPYVSYSDIEGGWPGDGNIDADPLFVDLDGPDDDPNTWEDNNYRLGPGSPCIDAANNDVVPADEFDFDGDGNTDEPIPFDLDGNPRFVDDPDTDDTGHGTPPIVDMGAYEFQAPRVGGFDRASVTDQSDLGILLAHWGMTCP